MFIKIVDSISNYKDAIKMSCDILESEEVVSNKYYDSIMKNIEIFGPYFCIADGVCMPHARPEDGALKEGLCILKVNRPVDFMGKKVLVFFTLSAKNNESHIGLLKKIAEVCMNREKFNNIVNAKNEKEIREVF